MRYERDGEGFVLVVEDGEEVRRSFEVAAWYETVRLIGGRYPVRATRIDFGKVADGARPYWALVSVPGRTVYRFLPSLFGGVPTGGGPVGETDEPTTYAVQTWWYAVEDAA